MGKIDKLEKLNQLRRDGAISDEEFHRLKQEAMDSGSTIGEILENETAGIKENDWGFILHISQLLNFLIPFAGIVAPVIIWQTKKDNFESIDRHGRQVANWMLSAFIYGLICIPFVFILIGTIPLMILGALGVVFPIIGAIEARKGNFWKYPITIQFLK